MSVHLQEFLAQNVQVLLVGPPTFLIGVMPRTLPAILLLFLGWCDLGRRALAWFPRRN